MDNLHLARSVDRVSVSISHREVGAVDLGQKNVWLVLRSLRGLAHVSNSTYRRKRVAGYIVLPFLLGAAVIFNFSRGGGIGRIPGWLLLGAWAASVVSIPLAIWADSAFRSDRHE